MKERSRGCTECWRCLEPLGAAAAGEFTLYSRHVYCDLNVFMCLETSLTLPF